MKRLPSLLALLLSPAVYASNLYPEWSHLAGVGSTFRGVTARDGYLYAVGSSAARPVRAWC